MLYKGKAIEILVEKDVFGQKIAYGRLCFWNNCRTGSRTIFDVSAKKNTRFIKIIAERKV